MGVCPRDGTCLMEPDPLWIKGFRPCRGLCPGCRLGFWHDHGDGGAAGRHGDARAVRWLGQFVASVADGETGTDLTVVRLLADIDPQVLDDADRVDLIRAWERCPGDAGRRAAAGAVCGRGRDRGAWAGRGAGPARGRCRVAAVPADRRGADLGGDLAAPPAAGDAGGVARPVTSCYLQAAHLVSAVRELDDAAAAAVEARVLGRAPEQTVAEFRRSVARAVIAADPASAADRHQKATAARTIERMPELDAMESYWATMPASISRDLWAALTAQATAEQAARAQAGLPDPGIGALRLDVLVHAVLHNGGADPRRPAAHHDQPARPTRRPGRHGAETAKRRRCRSARCGGAQSAAVVIDLATLLGLADNPGEIPGYGPIPAPMARAMAWDRDWVRWTVDPATGQLLDRGADTYRPSDKLRAFVADRDRVCGFPGCNQPAEQCDCDHIVTFAHHGQTIRVNLGPLCRQHHNAKTHGLWKLSYDPDTGIKTWTSPLGKTYTKSTDPPLT